MDLVYIYGPPGVGKFTTGKELSKITGYKLFHNQLSIEFVMSVFKFGTPSFNKLVLGFRSEMIEEAARSNTPLIFTSLYARGLSDKIFKDIIRRVEKNGGRVCLVGLYCDKKELLRRIRSRSRKNFFKIRSPGRLEQLMKRYEFSTVSFRKGLIIDNTRISPKKTAQMIASHYRLNK